MNSIKEIIYKDISLKSFCSYKTGGIAKYFCQPKNNEELVSLLNWSNINNINHTVIGGGSNILINDNGYNGLIICTNKLNKQLLIKDSKVIVGSGIKLMKLINNTLSKGLVGLEKLAGIPGTVGGAVKMNAGAYGTELKDTIKYIYAMDKSCNRYRLSNNEAKFDYRSSLGLDGLIITKIELELDISDSSELLNIKNNIIKKRKEKQPLNKPSCGSVFKRPKVGYAGEYIEKCGLRGYSIGGAMISEKHANFILNYNNATSKDIKDIIDHSISCVYQKFNILLEPEIKFIGY